MLCTVPGILMVVDSAHSNLGGIIWAPRVPGIWSPLWDSDHFSTAIRKKERIADLFTQNSVSLLEKLTCKRRMRRL
jgi:hypothetical protein